jgi:hypothetical protein
MKLQLGHKTGLLSVQQIRKIKTRDQQKLGTGFAIARSLVNPAHDLRYIGSAKGHAHESTPQTAFRCRGQPARG